MGMSAAATSMAAWSFSFSPVVPMTMAIPRSRQVFSQRRVDSGIVKSISTSGVGRRSNVIGNPTGPIPATSPAFLANSAQSGLSIAATNCSDLSRVASATSRLPIRPHTPVMASLITGMADPLRGNSKFEIRITGPRRSFAGYRNQIRNSIAETAFMSNFRF